MTLHTFPGMFCSLSPLKSCYSCSFKHWLHYILFSLAQVSSIVSKNLFYVIFCLFKQGSSEFSGSFRRLLPTYQAQKVISHSLKSCSNEHKKGLLQNSATQIAITISKISEKANNAKSKCITSPSKILVFEKKCCTCFSLCEIAA